jgi:HlyD family secretion protein
MKITRKRAVLLGIGLLVLMAMVYLFLPNPVVVQAAAVSRGPLQVTVEEEGETRVLDRYVVTAPVAAFLQRLDLEEGDAVEAGQVLARLEPPRAAILDPRSRNEADARVSAAQAAVAQAEVMAARAEADLGRVTRLQATGAATRQALEQTEAEAVHARTALDAARAELEAAEAAVRSPGPSRDLTVQDVIRAPAGGRVLVVYKRSEGQVMPGEPLLEVGNTERLQVEAEVLSRDAVRIRPGSRVVLDQWGGEDVLEATVTQVDPQGFTRVSALGVEERRVRVVADMVSPPEAYRGLGPGYRVLARFVVWEDADVLQVPTAALFRHQDGWAVFVVDDSRATLRPVTVGREAGLATQILEGLQEGEVIIVHPGNELEDGARVRVGNSDR